MIRIFFHYIGISTAESLKIWAVRWWVVEWIQPDRTTPGTTTTRLD